MTLLSFLLKCNGPLLTRWALHFRILVRSDRNVVLGSFASWIRGLQYFQCDFYLASIESWELALVLTWVAVMHMPVFIWNDAVQPRPESLINLKGDIKTLNYHGPWVHSWTTVLESFQVKHFGLISHTPHPQIQARRRLGTCTVEPPNQNLNGVRQTN